MNDKQSNGQVAKDFFKSTLVHESINVVLLDEEWKILFDRITVPAYPNMVNYKLFEMDMIQVNPQYAIMANYVDVENRNPKKILVEILREVFKNFKTPEEFAASVPIKQGQTYALEDDIWQRFLKIDPKLTKTDFTEIMKLLDPRRLTMRHVDKQIYFGSLAEAIVVQLLPLINEVLLSHSDRRKNPERF